MDNNDVQEVTLLSKPEVEAALVQRKALLDKVADLQDKYGELKSKILTPELQAELKSIDDECASSCASIFDEITAIEKTVESSVLQIGETVKVPDAGQAVWVKGRETVDMKMLKGYIISHPEAEQLVKTGDPTVQFRKA